MIAPIPARPIPIELFAAEVYPTLKPGLSPRTIGEYCSTAALLISWLARPLAVSELTEDIIRAFLLWRFQQGKSAPTVNKDRRQLLALWEAAHEFGYHERPPSRRRIRRWPEPKRIPTAWTVEELEQILTAAASSKPVQNWDAAHWRALVLTIYDTSHRIDCLLQVRWSQLLPGGFLHVLAEQIKRRRTDAIHKLHAQTLEHLAALPRTSERIWPWPISRRYIFEYYGRLLTAAGLPATKRDKFHRIRRTSYTGVMDRLGRDAARDHALHATDLSEIYCDPTKLTRTFACDVLQRPNL